MPRSRASGLVSSVTDSAVAMPASSPLDSGGRSYGRTSSSPTSVISPSYPADRSAWAVRTPPTEAPTMTVDLVICWRP